MNPEQVRALILEILPSAAYPPWYIALLVLATLSISACVGAWSGAYFRRRGEQAAARVGFDEILEQIRRQTKATEDIRSEIARGAWVQQQVWEFKKDLYTGLLGALAELGEATSMLSRLPELRSQSSADDEIFKEWIEKERERYERAAPELGKLAAIAKVVVSEATTRILSELAAQAQSVDSGVSGLNETTRLAAEAIEKLASEAKADLDL